MVKKKVIAYQSFTKNVANNLDLLRAIAVWIVQVSKVYISQGIMRLIHV